jgi:hypothetical protein
MSSQCVATQRLTTMRTPPSLTFPPGGDCLTTTLQKTPLQTVFLLLRVHIRCQGGMFTELIFLIGIVGGGVQLGPLDTAATNRPIVSAPGDYDDGEIGGMMIGRGNLSTRITEPLSSSGRLHWF